MDAAIDVFYAEGVARPSLSTIAERANVTRGAVYGHFKNKNDLFVAMCDRVPLPMETLCAVSDPASIQDPLGLLRRDWVEFLQRVALDSQWQMILNIIIHRCELTEDNGAILQRLQNGRRRGITLIRTLIQQAVTAGQLPSDLDTESATRFLHSGVVGILSDWLFTPTDFDLGAEAQRFVDSLLDVLRTSPHLRR